MAVHMRITKDTTPWPGHGLVSDVVNCSFIFVFYLINRYTDVSGKCVTFKNPFI